MVFVIWSLGPLWGQKGGFFIECAKRVVETSFFAPKKGFWGQGIQKISLFFDFGTKKFFDLRQGVEPKKPKPEGRDYKKKFGATVGPKMKNRRPEAQNWCGDVE